MFHCHLMYEKNKLEQHPYFYSQIHRLKAICLLDIIRNIWLSYSTFSYPFCTLDSNHIGSAARLMIIVLYQTYIYPQNINCTFILPHHHEHFHHTQYDKSRKKLSCTNSLYTKHCTISFYKLIVDKKYILSYFAKITNRNKKFWNWYSPTPEFFSYHIKQYQL